MSRFLAWLLRSVATGAAALTATPGHALSTVPWPDVPPPLKARVEWVARDARVNGLPTRIERFESTVSVEEMLAHYRAFWGNSPAGKPMERQGGGWRSISTRHGPFQIAVQVKSRDRSGSEGLISVVNFVEAKADFVPRNLPRVPDSKVVQVTESVDGPMRSFLVTLTSPQGADFNAQRYRDELESDGWALSEQMMVPGPRSTRSYFGSFRRNDESIEMTIAETKRRSSRITVNLVRPASKEPAQ